MTVQRPSGSSGCSCGRRLVRWAARSAAAVGLLAVLAPCALAGVPTHVPASRRLAVLLSSHRVFEQPRASSRQVALLHARGPITGERTTVPVIQARADESGATWLRVILPGRPNGSTGWIGERGTRETFTGWALVVSLAHRRVTVYRHGRINRTFAAVVGKPSTPTPSGSFYVEETAQLPETEPGGPYALALSARSNALQEFEGGPGQIAIHGRDLLGGALGAAESHGCMRLDTAAIEWLIARIRPGTPVTIHRG